MANKDKSSAPEPRDKDGSDYTWFKTTVDPPLRFNTAAAPQYERPESILNKYRLSPGDEGVLSYETCIKTRLFNPVFMGYRLYG